MNKIFLAIICMYGVISTTVAQSKVKRNTLNSKHKQTLDSLKNQSIDFSIIKEKYRDPYKYYEKMSFPKEQVILDNGIAAKYQTSDNKKVKDALSQIFTISPAEFLTMLRNIHGRIEIKTMKIQWVTYDDVADLLKLATVDVVTPYITQDVSDLVGKEQEQTAYKKTPMAINALLLINSYVGNGIFPSAPDAPPSYESVKAWYDSGKPANEYKFSILYPIMGLHPLRGMQPIKLQNDSNKNHKLRQRNLFSQNIVIIIFTSIQLPYLSSYI